MTTTFTRRSFVGGSAFGLAAMALAPRFAFAAGGSSSHTLVVVSLRGGMDGLSAVVPIESGYFDRRPTIAIPESRLLPLDGRFGLHPALAPMHDLWSDGRLALIPGLGTPTGSRSHFAETDLMQQGRGAFSGAPATGWISRHLQSRPGSVGELPAASLSWTLSPGLAGFPDAAAISNVGSYAVRGVNWRDRDRMHDALAQLQGGFGPLVAEQAATTLDTVRLLEDRAPASIEPSNGAVYPDHHWSRVLRQVGQLIRSDVGLEVATVDLGGWDTHADMGTWDDGYMATRLGDLGAALGAFCTDMDDLSDRVTVLITSEFGRRVAENASGGLDHGRGSLGMVLGAGVDGGIHGAWPGLAAESLDRGDVPTVVDYRAVLSEVVRDLLGNPFLESVFPGYTPQSVGVIA